MLIRLLIFFSLILYSFSGFTKQNEPTEWMANLHGFSRASPSLGYMSTKLSTPAVTSYVEHPEFQEALRSYPNQNRFLLVRKFKSSDPELSGPSFLGACHNVKQLRQMIPISQDLSPLPLHGAMNPKCSRLEWENGTSFNLDQIPELYFPFVQDLAIVELYRLVPPASEKSGSASLFPGGNSEETVELRFGGGGGAGGDENDDDNRRRRRKGGGFQFGEDLYLIGLIPLFSTNAIQLPMSPLALPQVPRLYTAMLDDFIQTITPPALPEPEPEVPEVNVVFALFMDSDGNTSTKLFSKDELEEQTGITIGTESPGKVSFLTEPLPDEIQQKQLVEMKILVEQMLTEYSTRWGPITVADKPESTDSKAFSKPDKTKPKSSNGIRGKLKKAFKKDKRSKQDDEPPAGNTFQCIQCPQAFNSADELKKHVKDAHGETEEVTPLAAAEPTVDPVQAQYQYILRLMAEELDRERVLRPVNWAHFYRQLIRSYQVDTNRLVRKFNEIVTEHELRRSSSLELLTHLSEFIATSKFSYKTKIDDSVIIHALVSLSESDSPYTKALGDRLTLVFQQNQGSLPELNFLNYEDYNKVHKLGFSKLLEKAGILSIFELFNLDLPINIEIEKLWDMVVISLVEHGVIDSRLSRQAKDSISQLQNLPASPPYKLSQILDLLQEPEQKYGIESKVLVTKKRFFAALFTLDASQTGDLHDYLKSLLKTCYERPRGAGGLPQTIRGNILHLQLTLMGTVVDFDKINAFDFVKKAASVPESNPSLHSLFASSGAPLPYPLIDFNTAAFPPPVSGTQPPLPVTTEVDSDDEADNDDENVDDVIPSPLFIVSEISPGENIQVARPRSPGEHSEPGDQESDEKIEELEAESDSQSSDEAIDKVVIKPRDIAEHSESEDQESDEEIKGQETGTVNQSGEGAVTIPVRSPEGPEEYDDIDEISSVASSETSSEASSETSSEASPLEELMEIYDYPETIFPLTTELFTSAATFFMPDTVPKTQSVSAYSTYRSDEVYKAFLLKVYGNGEHSYEVFIDNFCKEQQFAKTSMRKFKENSVFYQLTSILRRKSATVEDGIMLLLNNDLKLEALDFIDRFATKLLLAHVEVFRAEFIPLLWEKRGWVEPRLSGAEWGYVYEGAHLYGMLAGELEKKGYRFFSKFLSDFYEANPENETLKGILDAINSYRTPFGLVNHAEIGDQVTNAIQLKHFSRDQPFETPSLEKMYDALPGSGTKRVPSSRYRRVNAVYRGSTIDSFVGCFKGIKNKAKGFSYFDSPAMAGIFQVFYDAGFISREAFLKENPGGNLRNELFHAAVLISMGFKTFKKFRGAQLYLLTEHFEEVKEVIREKKLYRYEAQLDAATSPQELDLLMAEILTVKGVPAWLSVLDKLQTSDQHALELYQTIVFDFLNPGLATDEIPPRAIVKPGSKEKGEKSKSKPKPKPKPKHQEEAKGSLSKALKPSGDKSSSSTSGLGEVPKAGLVSNEEPAAPDPALDSLKRKLSNLLTVTCSGASAMMEAGRFTGTIREGLLAKGFNVKHKEDIEDMGSELVKELNKCESQEELRSKFQDIYDAMKVYPMCEEFLSRGLNN